MIKKNHRQARISYHRSLEEGSQDEDLQVLSGSKETDKLQAILPSSLLSLGPVSSRPRPKRSESFFSLKAETGGLEGGGGWTEPVSSSVTSERSSLTGNPPCKESSW